MHVYCCRYVIGGLRKKLNTEWNLPSTHANSLPATPVNVFPSNLRQFSNTTSEHRKIGLNSENMTSSAVLHSKASFLSNIFASKNAQATKPILPASVPISICQNSFNFNTKILNSQYKENILSHSTTSRVSGLSAIPGAIQSLAHNRLLKAILPASNQIFKLTAGNELKSSHCIANTNNYSTNLSNTSSKINSNQTCSLNNKNETSNVNSHHQDHVDENGSKIFCCWEDCKR